MKQDFNARAINDAIQSLAAPVSLQHGKHIAMQLSNGGKNLWST
jgi:hypothetical protein